MTAVLGLLLLLPPSSLLSDAALELVLVLVLVLVLTLAA
jgi:hypothetical protein